MTEELFFRVVKALPSVQCFGREYDDFIAGYLIRQQILPEHRVKFLNALRASLPQPASDFDLLAASSELKIEAVLSVLE